jgi:CRISPR/Cas system CSM-associated protein Csm3 (group 7 of RAMP superfamily)
VLHRTVIVLDLRLDSAAHFGGGEGAGLDAVVLTDQMGQAFIPGATVAGCLRAHLRWLLLPDDPTPAERDQLERRVIGRLFGWVSGNADDPDAGFQSPLIVEDAYPRPGSEPRRERRDGVAIDARRGAAREQAKFDQEVLAAGAVFRVRLTLEVRSADDAALLRSLVNLLLIELAAGQVALGARTRSGYGRVRLIGCGIQEQGLLEWLEDDAPAIIDVDDGIISVLDGPPDAARLGAIQLMIPADSEGSGYSRPTPRASRLRLRARFQLAGPLLVRSVPAVATGPDVVQVKTNGAPVVPGPSLRGIIRHRATRIARTLGTAVNADAADADSRALRLVDELFGPEHAAVSTGATSDLHAGRIAVGEHLLEQVRPYLHTRHRGDRVLGGVLPGHLFTEEPVYAGEDARDGAAPHLQVTLDVRAWKPEHTALLLHVLRDLWLGDVPVGGGASIGRGRLRGIDAELELVRDGALLAHLVWQTAAADQDPTALTFIVGGPAALEVFQPALEERLGATPLAMGAP